MPSLPCTACRGLVPEAARFCPHCGTPQASSGILAPGTVLDARYRIVSRLGQGGMSNVYLARHERLERDVAIKFLQPQLLADTRALTRFMREARISSSVAHRNIVEVYDFGASGGVPYLVMEHVPGIPLDAEIEQQGPMRLERAAHVLAQIADALAAAHALDLVHRDLKPANVVLTRRGVDGDFVKILDFGLAVSTKDDARLTKAGEVVGTPHYLSPEAWEGRGIDPRSDIYAFGVMAFELLTGRVPFDAPTLPGLMVAHIDGRRPAPSELVREAEPLDGMVLACLAAKPENRPQDAKELIDALRVVLFRTPAARRRTTYARALGTRPGRTPDPTVYDPTRGIDAYWDGPAISAEITALHGARRRRLKEFVFALWADRIPQDVAKRVAQIDMLDAAASEIGEQIAILDRLIEERDADARHREAELREALFVSNVGLRLAESRLPALDFDDDEATKPFERWVKGATAFPEQTIGRSERELEAFERTRQSQELDGRRQMELLVSRLDEVEQQLRAPAEALWQSIVAAAKGRPELKPALLELSKIDGAIASYQGLVKAAAPVRRS